jgi:hypothetical protein
MRSIARLFGPSPFKLLYRHAEKVHETVEELAKLLTQYAGGEPVAEESAAEIARLEHEADEIKQKIRGQLPRTLLLPVARSDLLEFLWQQDQIADNCQDAAALLALKAIDLPTEMREEFTEMAGALRKTAAEYKRMIATLSEVLETSFSKRRVNAITDMINELNRLEHEADLVEGKLVKMIYEEDHLDGFSRYHLISLVLKLGNVVDHMENAGGRLRIMVSR